MMTRSIIRPDQCLTRKQTTLKLNSYPNLQIAITLLVSLFGHNPLSVALSPCHPRASRAQGDPHGVCRPRGQYRVSQDVLLAQRLQQTGKLSGKQLPYRPCMCLGCLSTITLRQIINSSSIGVLQSVISCQYLRAETPLI